MYRRVFGAGLLLAFVVACAAPGLGADKKKPDDAKPTADADTLPAGSYSGKLKTPPGSDGSFIVAIDYSHYEMKPGYKPPNTNPQQQQLYRDQQRLAQLQTQLATARNQQQLVRLYQQLQQATAQLQNDIAKAQLTPQQNPYVLKTDSKDFTFHAAEDMKVRFTRPPSAFDEKGNVKEYTKDELKALKGEGADAKLEGYMGSVEKLTAGMQVKVTTVLNKPKKEDKKDPEKKADDKKADVEKKDPEKKDPEKKDMGPKTIVNLIVVQGDESSGTADSTPPKKKKN